VDVIGEWLSAARVSGTAFSRSELTEPWGFSYPAAPRIAFHIISRGRAYLRVPRQTCAKPLRQGDIVLLASGLKHELSSSPEGETEDIFAYLARRPLGRDRTIRHGGGGPSTAMLCGAYSLDTAVSGPLLSLLPAVVHLPADSVTSSPVEAMTNLLLQEFSLADQAGDTVLARLIDVLLIYVLRTWSALDPDRTHGWLAALRDPNLASVLVRVHEQPARAWTVATLAAEAGMSRSAFARRFALLVAEPPLSYVTRWRMTLAARLLADTKMPIATIASRVGYTSEHAFNRVFSRTRGIAPARWRAQVVKE